MPDENLDDVLDDVKNALNNVQDLPKESEKPTIKDADPSFKEAIKIALRGADYKELRTTSKKLRNRIEDLPGVARVDLHGYQIDEIRIEIDPQKLTHYGISVQEVELALKDRNLNLSAGPIKSSKEDIFVRTLAKFTTTEDIEKVIIRSNQTGYHVSIGDVASVKRSPEEGSIRLRSNGQRAIFFTHSSAKKCRYLKYHSPNKKNS